MTRHQATCQVTGDIGITRAGVRPRDHPLGDLNRVLSGGDALTPRSRKTADHTDPDEHRHR